MEDARINELLCFACHHFRKGVPASAIKSALIEFYTLEEFYNAKETVKSTISEDAKKLVEGSDAMKRRQANGGKVRMADDVLYFITTLDSAMLLPKYTAYDCDRVPNFEPNEAAVFSVCERIRELERQVKANTESILIHDNFLNRKDYKPSCSDISCQAGYPYVNKTPDIQITPPQVQCSGETSSGENENDGPDDMTLLKRTLVEGGACGTNDTSNELNGFWEQSKSARTERPAPPPRNTMPDRIAESPISETFPIAWSSLAEKCKDNEFSYPPHFKKKMKKHERDRDAIIKGTDMTRGRNKQTYNAFIYAIPKHTVDDELFQYIKNNEIQVHNLFRINNPDSKYKSYRVEIHIDSKEKLFNPDIWPKGVGVRQFKFPRGDSIRGRLAL